MNIKNIQKQNNQVSEKVKENVFSILKDIPIHFIENKGQIDERVKYYAKGSNYVFYFTKNEAKFSFMKKKGSTNNKNHEIELIKKGNKKENLDNEFMRVTIGQEFINANEDAKIEGISKLKGTVNYFKGNDPENWKTKIPTFEKIIYKDIWNGIDLNFYCKAGKLKYDFVVKKGGRVKDIEFSYNGLYEKYIDDMGNLRVKTPMGELMNESPICYQKIKGEKINIKGEFIEIKKKRETSYGYKIEDNYNPSYNLIIDPGILYSSFLGGNFTDKGEGIAIDENENVYITGETYSKDFPIENAFQPIRGGSSDAFVTKIDTTPAIVYSSYIGGVSADNGNGIAVDKDGNAYIIGQTSSNNFPITDSAFQKEYGGGSYDGFVTKVSSSGSSMVYSSYIGGSGSDDGLGITVDNNGEAYITGGTGSSDFLTTENAFQMDLNGTYDAIVTKVSSSGSSILYSSYLGGNSFDKGAGIALGKNNSVYITGTTRSDDFPTKNEIQSNLQGSSDCFITKIDLSNSNLLYSTYLGGDGGDGGNGIAIDENENAYIIGHTTSTDFPTKNAFQENYAGGMEDGFVTKISSSGSSIVYSTYIGGSDWDRGNGIAIDKNKNAYITGYTASDDFPIKNAFQSMYGGDSDAFVTKIDSTPNIVYSSYLGGSRSDRGSGIAIDKNNNAYITGYTGSWDFPIENAFQENPTMGLNVFVTKIGFKGSLRIHIARLTAELFD